MNQAGYVACTDCAGNRPDRGAPVPVEPSREDHRHETSVVLEEESEDPKNVFRCLRAISFDNTRRTIIEYAGILFLGHAADCRLIGPLLLKKGKPSNGHDV